MTYRLDEIGATEPADRPEPGRVRGALVRLASGGPVDRPESDRLRAALVLVASVVAAVLVGIVAVLALRDRPHRPPVAQAPPPPPAVVELPTAAPPSPGPTSAAPVVAATVTPPPRKATRAAPPKPGAPKPPPPPPNLPPPPAPTAAPPGGCTGCEMPGDGTTPVGGTDPRAVRVGTYHSDGPSGTGGCSWWLARDPAGDDQIAGKTVDHATDVIVKDRTYFHSENCRTWRLRPVNPDFI